MSIRNDVLGGKLDRLLQRYSPPRGMDTQAQSDETAALMRAIDRAAPRNDYEGWWSRFEDVLLESLTTRAWPTVGDIAKAASRIGKDDRNAPNDVDPEVLYSRVVAFWVQCRTPLKTAMRPGFCERMVAEGVATWGDLEWHHFPLSFDQRVEGGRQNKPKYDAIMDALHAESVAREANQAPRGVFAK